MNAIVSAIRSNLTALDLRVNAAYGMPIRGVDVGGGTHCVSPQGDTVQFAQMFKHPTLEQWAYPVDGIENQRLSAPDRALVATAVVLTADWFPTRTP